MSDAANSDISGAEDRAVARVLWITLGLNLLVAALKVVAGRWAGLVAVYADGLHSLTDGVSNVVGLVSLYYASRPPDADHPYGHQKIEIFAAGAVGLFLLGTAATITIEVYRKVTGVVAASSPEPVILAVMIGTFAVNLFVALYERRRGQQLKSAFLLSDSAHTASDLAVTAGVLISVVLGWAGFEWIDPVVGAIVAVWILWVGIRIVKENADYLADRALLDPGKIQDLVMSVGRVTGCTQIRSRGTPGKVFLDLSIQVDAKMTVGEAHRVSHDVADALKAGIPGIRDVTVHVEPVG